MSQINTFITLVQQRLAALPLYLHGLAAVLSYTLTRASNYFLDKSYAASQYPVPFYTGQTTFNATKLKSYYAHMLKEDTLQLYWQTQWLDFSFIASIFLAGLVISLFLARLHPKGTLWYRLSYAAAFIMPFAALCDVFENLFSFIMLTKPLTFADWLVIPYSSFAVCKFIGMALSYFLWLSSLLVWLIRKATFSFLQKHRV